MVGLRLLLSSLALASVATVAHAQRASTCASDAVNCPAELDITSSFHPYGCYNGERPSGQLYYPFTTVEECTHRCSGSTYMRYDSTNSAQGCACFGSGTVWSGGSWVTCDLEANHVFINMHDHDPDNTCADNSIWNCPAALDSRGQGYEPYGCYSLAYGYSMGGGNSVTQGVVDIDTCAAKCSATSVKMAYSATSQECECFDSTATFATTVTCDSGRNVYSLSTLHASTDVQTCSDLGEACPAAIDGSETAYEPFGCWRGYQPQYMTSYSPNTISTIQQCATKCGSDSYMSFDTWDESSDVPGTFPCSCFSSSAVFVELMPASEAPFQCYGRTSYYYNSSPLTVVSTTTIASTTSTTSAAPTATSTPRAATCASDVLNCPQELNITSSFHPYGCYNGEIPSGQLYYPFTTVEECTHRCSGSTYMRINAAYPSDGCDCFGPDTVWDGGTWVTCDDEANHVFINTHDNDPDNTCADSSIWNCPAALDSRGQGYEPFGCYSLAYGYSMGGGNSVTQGVADIDTCGARCSATSVKMAYSSTSQQCECFDSTATFATTVSCDSGRNVYSLSTLHASTDVQTCSDLGQACPAAIEGSETAFEPFGCWNGYQPQYRTFYSANTISTIQECATQCGSDSYMHFDDYDGSGNPATYPCYCFSSGAVFVDLLPESAKPYQCYGRTSYYYNPSPVVAPTTTSIASSSTSSVASSTSVSSTAPSASSTARAATCAADWPECPQELNFTSSFHPYGCYNAEIPREELYYPFTTIEECTHLCSGSTYMRTETSDPNQGCECFGSDTVWKWMGGSATCDDESNRVFINTHDNDPVNTCASDSVWNCPAELDSKGQGYEPFGCYNWAYNYALGGANTLTEGVADIDTCTAQCSATSVKMAYSATTLKCECFDSNALFGTPVACDSDRNVYTLSELHSPDVVQTCADLTQACPAAIVGSETAFEPFGCWRGYQPQYQTYYSENTISTIQQCATQCESDSYMKFDTWDESSTVPGTYPCSCYSSSAVFVYLMPASEAPYQCYGRTSYYYNPSPVVAPSTTSIASSTTSSVASSTSVSSAAPSASSTPRATTCASDVLNCPQELNITSSFHPYGCYNGEIPSGQLYYPFTTVEECTHRCSGSTYMRINAAYPSDGCDCFGPDTVWDGGTWVTCDDEANHVFINTHDNDPDNTCADSSIWNCPAELNSLGQGYEPFGCYSLAYGYSMGGGNSVTQGIANIATCAAKCSATSVKMAYNATTQQCECFDSTATFATTVSCDTGRKVYSLSKLHSPDVVQTCADLDQACPPAIAGTETGFEPFGCWNGHPAAYSTTGSWQSTLQDCATNCESNNYPYMYFDDFDDVAPRIACQCFPANAVFSDQTESCYGRTNYWYNPLNSIANVTSSSAISSSSASSALPSASASAAPSPSSAVPSSLASNDTTSSGFSSSLIANVTSSAVVSSIEVANATSSALSSSAISNVTSTAVSSSISSSSVTFSANLTSAAVSSAAPSASAAQSGFSSGFSTAFASSTAASSASGFSSTSAFASASAPLSASATSTASSAPLSSATAVLAACQAGDVTCPSEPENDLFRAVGCFGTDSIAFTLSNLAAGTAFGDYLEREACLSFCASTPYAAWVQSPAVDQSSCSCFPDSPLLKNAPLVTCNLSIVKRAASGVVELLDNPSAVIPTSPATPSQAIKKRLRQQALQAEAHVQKYHAFCPEGLLPCNNESGDGYECLDVHSELTSCGGCVWGRYDDLDDAAGDDCTILPGVIEGGVECANGLCIAHKCRSGWLLADGQCKGQKRRFWD